MDGTGPAVVGVIVNPLAGKDIRRLVAQASHTPDTAKIGIVRRAVIAAAESGARHILLAADPHHLARRAVEGLDLAATVELLDLRVSGSRRDTVRAAAAMWKRDVGAVIALGGDGTCRDVAMGWPDVPLIAISTGTNNVFPSALDATAAGCAAGLVASGAVPLATVGRRAKRVSVRIEVLAHAEPQPDPTDDLALVEVALIDTTFVGARAVTDPTTIRSVVAAFATPMGTGLSALAGRAHPVGRWDDGGVMVRLGPGGRRLRLPIAPGTFTDIDLAEVVPLSLGQCIEMVGPGVLAFDGERDRRLTHGQRVALSVDAAGPIVIDVELTLALAAQAGLFDQPIQSPQPRSIHSEQHKHDTETFDGH